MHKRRVFGLSFFADVDCTYIIRGNLTDLAPPVCINLPHGIHFSTLI